MRLTYSEIISVHYFFNVYQLFHVNFNCKSMIAEIAQLGERQTEDLKVPGSNPDNSHEF